MGDDGSPFVKALRELAGCQVPVTVIKRTSSSLPSSLIDFVDKIFNTGLVEEANGGLVSWSGISSNRNDGAKGGLSRRLNTASYAKAYLKRSEP